MTHPDDRIPVDIEMTDEGWARLTAHCAAIGEDPAHVAERVLLQYDWRELLRTRRRARKRVTS